MLIVPNSDSRMRKLPQPWNLRRSFGGQPVGNVAGPRWPEAGITAQEIPSLSLRWTFREGQRLTADLPTCRLGYRLSYPVQAKVLVLTLPSTGGAGISLQAALPEHTKPSHAQIITKRRSLYHSSASYTNRHIPLTRNREEQGL